MLLEKTPNTNFLIWSSSLPFEVVFDASDDEVGCFAASESDTDVSTVASFLDSSDDDIVSELEDTNDLEKESIVKVVAGNYEGYYAEVIGTSHGDEVEVQRKVPRKNSRSRNKKF